MEKIQTKDRKFTNNKIKRIDWEILTSIIKYLYYHPYEKKTNLATKIGLQYSRFVKYLNWLQYYDMVDIVVKDRYDTILLNKKGIRISIEFYILTE